MRLPVDVPARSIVRITVWGYFPRLDLTPTKKKQTDVSPLSTAEFRAHDGALLAHAGHGPAAFGQGRVASRQRKRPDHPACQPDAPNPRARNYDLTLCSRGSANSRDRADGGDGCTRGTDPPSAGVVVDQGGRPRRARSRCLDLEQRQRLLEYIRGGGVVVLAAPARVARRVCQTRPTSAHKLVRCPQSRRPIGSRVATQVEVSAEANGAGKPPQTAWAGLDRRSRRKPTAPTCCCAAATTCTSPPRSVGLGKIVFTSFPMNGLDASQPQAAALWEQLLDLRRPQWDWSRHAARRGSGTRCSDR